MKSKAASCGSISTVFSSIVLPCVSSVMIIRVKVLTMMINMNVDGRVSADLIKNQTKCA